MAHSFSLLLACHCVALAVYSLLFMRWALAVTPANYPLLVCHVSNEVVQLVQLGRYAAATKATDKPAATPAALKP